jgi:hypothetical protein
MSGRCYFAGHPGVLNAPIGVSASAQSSRVERQSREVN